MALAFGTSFQAADLTTGNITEELTQFRIVDPGEAWWSPALKSNREEYLYNRTPVTGITTAQTPLTMRTADGTHIAIHEAALIDYSGMNIRQVEGGLLEAVLTYSAAGPKVSRATPFATPWRVILVTPDAPSLYAPTHFSSIQRAQRARRRLWSSHEYVASGGACPSDTQSWNSRPHGAQPHAMKSTSRRAGLADSDRGWNSAGRRCLPPLTTSVHDPIPI